MKKCLVALSVLVFILAAACVGKKPVDSTAPEWASGYPKVGTLLSTSAGILVQANEACSVYALVLADGAVAPSAASVRADGLVLDGVAANSERTFALTGLSNSTAYDVYLVAEDASDNLQAAPAFLDIQTSDGVAPAWADGYPAAGTIGVTGAEVLVQTDEASTVYALILDDGTAEPTAADVKATGAYSVECAAGAEAAIDLSGLEMDTDYDVWLAAEDSSDNLQASAAKLDITTLPDTTAPQWMTSYPKLDTTSAVDARIWLDMDEDCTVFAVARSHGSGAPAPVDVVAGPGNSIEATAGVEIALTVTGLNPVTTYDIYLVARDGSGNVQDAAALVEATTLAVQVEVVYIPGISNFSMGWTGGDGSAPVHTVASISAFRIATYETTYALWEQVRAWAVSHGYTFLNNGENRGATPDCPVVLITWRDIFAWCNAFSEYNGYTPCYYTEANHAVVYRDASNSTATLVNVTGAVGAQDCVLWTANGYRLPTEAEWEYAARRNADGSIAAGNLPAGCASSDTSTWDDYAWFGIPQTGGDNSTHPVTSLLPNGMGLYNMSGNAWEICWDWKADYTTSSPYTDANSKGAASGELRIMRGGGIHSNAADFRDIWISVRHAVWNNQAYSDVGFRLVRNP